MLKHFMLLLFVLLAITPASLAEENPKPNVGINLGGVNYYSVELPWQDRFKGAMPLQSQEIGKSWGVGVPQTLRPDGYPAFLPTNHVSLALWDQPPGYPAQRIIILYDGRGSVEVGFGATRVSATPGRVVAEIRAGSERMVVKITATNPADPVRNIRMVPLAKEKTYSFEEPAYPWDPAFIENWGMMASYRFMDWGKTNNSTVASWEQRTTRDHQTQAWKNGVALEYQIQLANQTRKHPWICIPHQADDNYVRQAAILIRDTLDQGLVARVEYSNEVWNSIFQQAAYARQRGLALKLSGNEYEAQLRYYSQRAVEIFDIFADTFTYHGARPEGMKRLLRIMASQSASPWVSEQVLTWKNAWKKTDALAIAPYFGETITSAVRAAQIKEMSWQERIAWAWNCHAKTLEQMRSQAAIAGKYRVRLFAYEAGQHFVGGRSLENDTALTDILQELNRRSEMRQMYLTYLQGWQAVGGQDIMLFSSTGKFTKWGSWGLREYQTQPLNEAPKMQGVMDFIASSGEKRR